jgi:hypothetical protein
MGRDLLGFILAKRDLYDYVLIIQVNEHEFSGILS